MIVRMEKLHRFALWGMIASHLVGLAGVVIGFQVAPFFQVNNQQDRMFFALCCGAPLVIIGNLLTSLRHMKTLMEQQRDQEAEWDQLVNANGTRPDGQPDSN
jgi:hypothetical protein